MLRVHEDTFSLSDLVLNPSFFPGIRVGDIVAIRPIPDGDDGSGDVASPKGPLDTESGTSGAHSSEPSNTGKGKGAAPPHVKSSATPAGSGQTADPSEPSADSKPGSSRVELRDQPRGVALDAGRTSDARRSGRPLSSHMPKAPSKWRVVREGSAEFARDMERADDDHNESILRPDPHREILVKVGEVRRDTQQLQASIVNHIARALWGDYPTNQRVAIRKIDMSNPDECESIRADFVEIAFRDQYVGRSDMWRLWRNLACKIVHNNKPTNMEGLIRASVRRIYKNGNQIPCGYIDSQSQPIFRSESGRFIIFIQMSEEMWSYQEDGNMCFEKVVNSFMTELFRRWNEKQLNHMVTIVMFSRWFYSARDALFFQDLTLDEDSGRYYRDYYKVIADMEVRPDWSVFLPEILSEFNSYRRDIQEIQTIAGHRLRGDLSKAHQGNILEAINLGINSFASNHVDRDLSRTGLSTIVITPSFGVFDVTKKLLRMTTERMLHYGMRADFVCLTPRPLFRPPAFRFKAPPVPTEQEQRRALMLRQKNRVIEKQARETELNSVSPLDEGPPGFVSPVTSIPTSALPKDRGEKVSVLPSADVYVPVDPIMLDPLYFNDRNWEKNLLPYLVGTLPRSYAADDSTKTSAALAASTTGLAPIEKHSKSDLKSLFAGSVASVLLSDSENISDIPSAILELRADDYPFFSQPKASSAAKDRRVDYCYFPHWVDCGFYNNFDEPASERANGFKPSCKMGDLPVTGVANYMRATPSVPDLDLSAFDHELTAALKFDTQSASGGDSIADERLRSRDEDSRSMEAQFFSTTREIGHGRILPLGRKLPSVHSREHLLDLFAEYDRQAIVGLSMGQGATAGAQPAGDHATGTADSTIGAMPQSVMLVHTGGTSEHRLPLGSTNAASQQSIILPSNASAHWDDHQHSHYSRHLDSRVATERVEVGSAGSVEALDNLLATVSTSASPNLGHGQHIKPPPRTEPSASSSSSVPRDVNLGGAGIAGPQRSSIFMRNSSQRKRPQQNVKMQSTLEAIESAGPIVPPTAPQTSQRRTVPGHGASPERSLHTIAGGSKGRVAIADPAGRQSMHRVAESPQSITRGQYIQQNYNRLSGETSLVTPGERLPVVESVAKQSHLEEIRTFRGPDSQGVSPKHQYHSLQQTPPGIAMPMGVVSHRHSTLPSALLSETDFHLTLPNGRQATALPYSAVGPSQPSAPVDYHSGSPQYGKGLLLSDRLLLGHIPDASPKGQRGRYFASYNPCSSTLNSPMHNELSQRWAFALPTYSSLSSYTPKWRSLCTPASLPLVTDYYPPDLDTFYEVFSYDIQTQDTVLEEALDLQHDDAEEFSQFMASRTPASVSASASQMSAMQRIDRSTRIMLKEMVYQRLAQGFQFIKITDATTPRSTRDRIAGSSKRGPLFRLNGRSDGIDRLAVRSGSGGGAGIATGSAESFIATGSPHSNILPSGVSQKLDRSIWMSNGRQFQKLELQDSSVSNHTPGVTVTRWERKNPFDEEAQHYKFHMWPRNNNAGYRSADIRLSYPRNDEVNWNNHDYLIVGYQTNSTKATKYWRARYILVPSDNLGSETNVNSKAYSQMSVEDVRIANFEKFLDHILRLLRKDERAMLEERFFGALPIDIRLDHKQTASATGGNPYGPVGFGYPIKKLIGLIDLVPSMLMQIRYTTMYPVPYLSYQL
ncbi:vacuolar membrane-associated protein iml1, partial [Coemansia furcata]